MRRAFTLMEVNLAIMVMAVGILTLVSLYSLGYRESQQSREDVEAAALAELNMNALATMLSSTNMAWSAWNGINTQPSSGWRAYFNPDAARDDDGRDETGASTNPNGISQGAFDAVKGKCSGCEGAGVSFDPGHLKCGLVVHQEGSRCSISFRAARRPGSLVYQPMYYTEVHFQGDPSK